MELLVQGMTCGHCVKAVTNALQTADASAQVSVDLQGGRVTVETRLPREQVEDVIRAEGYAVVG